MNWLKLYHDLRTDRKVETLADDEYRTFINLLLFASEQDDHRGEIAGVDDDLIALEVCRGDTDLLARTLDRLRKLRIVSVGEGVTRYITFLHFAERQARKPSDEPGRILERVHKHRQAKRNASNQEGNAPVTRYVTPPVTPVTPRNAHREEEEGESFSSPTEKRAPDADAPDAPPAQMRLSLPKAQTTDAVRAANTVLGKKCNEAERAAINEAIPATPQAQTLWESVLRSWRLRYERNRSLEGPLEWFAAGGAPARSHGSQAKTNGAPRSASSRLDAVIERATNGHAADAGGGWGGPGVGVPQVRRGLPRQLPG